MSLPLNLEQTINSLWIQLKRVNRSVGILANTGCLLQYLTVPVLIFQNLGLNVLLILPLHFIGLIIK